MINIPFLKRRDITKMGDIFRLKELEKYAEAKEKGLITEEEMWRLVADSADEKLKALAKLKTLKK
ncbi:MAG: hypothetical protein WC310_05770 [Patescibacteria group bacterium]|jgi:hypothetical protein